jgi:hypothetical protein
MPNSRPASATGPEPPKRSSILAVRPVWNTSVDTFRPPSLAWAPTGNAAALVLLQLATTSIVPSGPYRCIEA